jgi:hypothetical protein
MTQPEIELASELNRLFPDATPRGRASWSVALQNGRSHLSRVSLEDDILSLTTAPLAIHGSPQSVAAMNASLPAASRIVCAVDGLRLRTEWSLPADAPIGKICESAVYDFQAGLDLFCGAPVPQPITSSIPAFEKHPSPHWNARENGDGTWSVPLPDHRAVLRASESFVKVDIIPGSEPPDEVRSAVAEYLLRGTFPLRFVKACASPDSAAQWAAWIQASPAVCGMDEALTSVAVAYRECAPSARALSEPWLAQRFREIGSIWRARLAPIPKERR